MKALPQGGPIRECVEGGVMSELPQSGASPIQRSWERCLHQGLSRQQSAELDLLPQGELSARQEQHRTLIACFQRFVLPLFGQLLAGRPCRLLLCDGEGAILAVSGDDRFARHAERIFLVHRGFPGKAALIFRKKYSESLNPYAIRFITLILLFTPSSTLVCIG